MPPATMTPTAFPYTTRQAAWDVLAQRGTLDRPLSWVDAQNQIEWLYGQDNGQMLSLVERVPNDGETLDNVRQNWREMQRRELATTYNNAVAAADTYLDMVDPYIAVVGTFLFSPHDGEVMEVINVDYTKANGWVNGVGDSCNILVERAQGTTVPIAKLAGNGVIAGPAYMAEQDAVKDGMGEQPGAEMHNFLSLASTSLSVTRMQNNTMVYDNWGQVPKAQVEILLQARRHTGYALLFAPRMTKDTSGRGQLYIGSGALPQIRSNILDLRGYASNVSWPIYNAFFLKLFRPDATSQEKTCLAGENLFATMLRMGRDLNLLDRDSYFEPEIGANVMTIRTEEGNAVNFIKDRFGLQAGTPYFLGDWGFVFDMAHLSGAHLEGFQGQWYQNIQDNDDLTTRKDAYMWSWMLRLMHESCHGVIRGGVSRLLERP